MIAFFRIAVVAHPLCPRWCKLAAMVEKVHGYKKHEDGGLFEFAIGKVRENGGVLEHPAGSAAFHTYGLPCLQGHAVWSPTLCGGYVTEVDQCAYGHLARKRTWLYAYGIDPSRLPSLKKGGIATKIVSYANHRIFRNGVQRLSKKGRNATPEKFAKMLISIAKIVRR